MNYYETKEYLNEKNKFFFLDYGKDLDTTKYKTDNKTYAMTKTDDYNPTWVWTKDNLTDEEYSLVAQQLYDFLVNGESRFTSKKEFYNYLVKVKHELLLDYKTFLLGFLEVKELVKPKKVEGRFRKATLDDVDVLVKYFFDLSEEEGHKVGSVDAVKEKVVRFVNEGLSYLWEDNNGKVVSTVEYKLVGNRAKVAGVYTPKEERRKGYCLNTVYELSKLLLDKGYEVFLFTDYTYKNSNEAYKKLGYKDEGYLVNYNLKRK